MPENEPTSLNPVLQQAMDEALRPLFGDNLPAFYAEQQRYDEEIRELQERARRVTNELLTAAVDRLTFFGGDRLAALPEAHRITQAQREQVDTELHDALVEARERFNRRVKALEIPKDEE